MCALSSCSQLTTARLYMNEQFGMKVAGCGGGMSAFALHLRLHHSECICILCRRASVSVSASVSSICNLAASASASVSASSSLFVYLGLRLRTAFPPSVQEASLSWSLGLLKHLLSIHPVCPSIIYGVLSIHLSASCIHHQFSIIVMECSMSVVYGRLTP